MSEHIDIRPRHHRWVAPLLRAAVVVTVIALAAAAAVALVHYNRAWHRAFYQERTR